MRAAAPSRNPEWYRCRSLSKLRHAIVAILDPSSGCHGNEVEVTLQGYERIIDPIEPVPSRRRR